MYFSNSPVEVSFEFLPLHNYFTGRRSQIRFRLRPSSLPHRCNIPRCCGTGGRRGLAAYDETKGKPKKNKGNTNLLFYFPFFPYRSRSKNLCFPRLRSPLVSVSSLESCYTNSPPTGQDMGSAAAETLSVCKFTASSILMAFFSSFLEGRELTGLSVQHG